MELWLKIIFGTFCRRCIWELDLTSVDYALEANRVIVIQLPYYRHEAQYLPDTINHCLILLYAPIQSYTLSYSLISSSSITSNHHLNNAAV